MNHVNAQLAARYGQLASRRALLTKQQSTSSIELSVSNTNNPSIELPQEIESLITGPEYWKTAKQNRYKMLVREGHLNNLLQLAAMAAAKNVPANWFATACSKVEWDRTLKFLAKLAKVQETAELVAQKLRTEVTKFIYQQIWRGVNVERWADTAAEVGRHKGKYFAWLCRREAAC